MFTINGLRNASRLSGIIARSYHNSIVSAPPEVKMSTGEKAVAFLCIAGTIFVSPMYFIPHFRSYGKNKEE